MELKGRKKTGESYSSPAVEQAGKILFCLAQSQSTKMGLMEICKMVGISASKAHGILEALQKSGLVRRGREGKGYSLGQGLVILSRKFLEDLVPSKLAESMLKKLTRDTDKTSIFGLRIGNVVHVTARHDRGGSITIGMRTGRIMPLTQGAHGKAIAAFLPSGELEAILKTEELYFYGTPKLFDRDRLMDELEQCRKNGYAADLTESTEGIMNIIAAPVFGSLDEPIGFVQIFDLSLSKDASELGPMVVEAARNLSRELGAKVN